MLSRASLCRGDKNLRLEKVLAVLALNESVHNLRDVRAWNKKCNRKRSAGRHLPALVPAACRWNELKLARFPALTHVLPPNSNFRFCPSMSLAPPRLHSRRYPPWLCLLCRFPQTLHSLTRDVFYVAFPKSSIRSLGLPIYVARFPSASFAEIANDLKRSQI